jgi:ABC-2 type transport system ATP-binding protein
VGRREVRDLILELKREGRTVFFSTHILPDAETLCDRVGVLSEGRLRGCGSVEELVSMDVQGVEIVFELSAGATLPDGLQVTRTGDRYRCQVPEADLYAAIDRLRQSRARIVSVVRIHPSLEDYFFRLMKK